MLVKFITELPNQSDLDVSYSLTMNVTILHLSLQEKTERWNSNRRMLNTNEL